MRCKKVALVLNSSNVRWLLSRLSAYYAQVNARDVLHDEHLGHMIQLSDLNDALLSRWIIENIGQLMNQNSLYYPDGVVIIGDIIPINLLLNIAFYKDDLQNKFEQNVLDSAVIKAIDFLQNQDIDRGINEQNYMGEVFLVQTNSDLIKSIDFESVYGVPKEHISEDVAVVLKRLVAPRQKLIDFLKDHPDAFSFYPNKISSTWVAKELARNAHDFYLQLFFPIMLLDKQDQKKVAKVLINSLYSHFQKGTEDISKLQIIQFNIDKLGGRYNIEIQWNAK